MSYQRVTCDSNQYLDLQVNLSIIDQGKIVTTQIRIFTHVTVYKNSSVNFSLPNILVCDLDH